MFVNEKQNYYDILDINPDASPNEIRQAYLKTKSAYSKGSPALYSLFDMEETKSIVGQIEEAYLVLSNPEKRKEYDKVHGFFSANESPMGSEKSAPTNNASQKQRVLQSNRTGDPAHVAAIHTFGSGFQSQPAFGETPGETQNASKDFNDLPSMEAVAEAKRDPKEYTREEEPHRLRYNSSNFGESEPASTSKSRSLGEDYHSSSKIGTVRRTELPQKASADPAFEEEIQHQLDFRGEFLKRVREYRGIGIEELSEYTKISKTYLNNIEAENYERLPAAVYLRGFVVQVARALKLPTEKAAVGYMKAFTDSQKKITAKK